MDPLKSALESLDGTIDRLSAVLDARLGRLEGALSGARDTLATLKAKNTAPIVRRIEEIEAEMRAMQASTAGPAATQTDNAQ